MEARAQDVGSLTFSKGQKSWSLPHGAHPGSRLRWRVQSGL